MRMGCPKCRIAMEIKDPAIGIEAMTSGGGYAYFDGNLWHCPGCGIEVVVGVGGQQAKQIFQIWLNQREKKAYGES